MFLLGPSSVTCTSTWCSIPWSRLWPNTTLCLLRQTGAGLWRADSSMRELQPGQCWFTNQTGAIYVPPILLPDASSRLQLTTQNQTTSLVFRYWDDLDPVPLVLHPVALLAMVVAVGIWRWSFLQSRRPGRLNGWLLLTVLNGLFVVISQLLLWADYLTYFESSQVQAQQLLYFVASCWWVAASSSYWAAWHWFRRHQPPAGCAQLGFVWMTAMGTIASVTHLGAFTLISPVAQTSRWLELLTFVFMVANLTIYGLFTVVNQEYFRFREWPYGIWSWVAMLLLRTTGLAIKASVLWQRLWLWLQWDGELPSPRQLQAWQQSFRDRILVAHAFIILGTWMLLFHSWKTWHEKAKTNYHPVPFNDPGHLPVNS